MQGISGFSPSAAAGRCPYLQAQAKQAAPAAQNSPESGLPVADSVQISPFEPMDSAPLSKTCMHSAAKATFPMLPGFAKAGCPHAA